METTAVQGGHRHEARCHAQLARLLAAAGKHGRAVGHYELALGELAAAATPGGGGDLERQVQLDRSKVRAQLARSLAALKRHRDAALVYESVLLDDPEDADAHVNLAAQCMIQGGDARLRDAVRLCSQALALRPSFPEAHYNLNVAMRRIGRQGEAVDMSWRCLERDHGLCRPVLSTHSSIAGHEGVPTADASDSGRVAVLCVKWGAKYGPEYVNKLYRSVMRQSGGGEGAARLDVFCLTDDAAGILPQANLHCLQLEEGWKGWWNKCQVFAPHVTVQVSARGLRRCVYIDLDTVIVGGIGDLLAAQPQRVQDAPLALLRTDGMANERRSGGHNSSIMAWSAEAAPQLSVAVYQSLKEHLDAVCCYIYKFDHWLEMVVPHASFLQDALPGQIVEYCSLDTTNDGDRALPRSARVVCFPLRPKPHEATASWLQEFWT